MTVSLRRQRRARTRATPSYLIVAQADRLDELRLATSILPLCAHGRVIVEAPAEAELPLVELPARLGLTRHRAAEGAVRAWASEMLCEDDARGPAEGSVNTGSVNTARPGRSVWILGDAEFRVAITRVLAEDYGLAEDTFLFA